MAFSRYADGPGQIRAEGQEITIKFSRTSDTTGLITWNIPRPSAGCDSTTQAYDGIVVTLDNKAANYITTSPQDGVYYNADPTGDRDLFLGDHLDTALVIGAFYNDKKTTSLVVTGLSPRTPYYISGYAVDAQARYHREGVHAYSLPSGVGQQETPDTAAYQDIQIYSQLLMTPSSATGLEADKEYKFAIQMCCKRYDYTIKGSDALSYRDLVKAINAAFTESTCTFRSPLPPNAGELYLNEEAQTLQTWTGWKYIPEHILWAVDDPSQPKLGAYWHDTKNDVLYVFTTEGWVKVTNIITQKTDPTKLVCGQVWFDGTNAWEWAGTHWTELCVIVSERNPLFPPLMDCETYWYDKSKSYLMVWDATAKKWVPVNAIYSKYDPESHPYWYDEKDKKAKGWDTDKYVELSNVTYRERTKTGKPPRIPADYETVTYYWYEESTGKIHVAENINLEPTWVEKPCISYDSDPSDHMKSPLWWNATTDKLMTWDGSVNSWVEVQKFYQTETDPRIPPVLDDCAIWYNPVTKKMIKILSPNCDEAEVIFSKYPPNNLPVGTIWRKGKNEWYIWDGTKWLPLDVIAHDDNPYIHNDGVYWYNPKTKLLYVLENGVWTEVKFSTKDLTPTKGELWFNTVENITLAWDGVTWMPWHSFAYVEFKERTCKEDYEFLRFSTARKGCESDCEVDFKIIVESGNLFSHLKPSVIYSKEVSANSGLVKGPSYEQLGIGTDGSPAERRALADTLLNRLGAPTMTVELTKEQLDTAINNALKMVRKHSAYGYHTGLFFLDILPNQQVYRLVNECVGFHKIVNIKALRRSRGTPFKGAYAWNDAFSFAALQQMYTLGTFDILTYHLTASYMEELETLFAQRIMFNWVERTRELRLFNWINNHERVLVEATIERTEQDLIVDRETSMWIENWALAECYQILGNIRGKYQSLPGPNGTTVLNGSEIAQTAIEMKQNLMQEIEDMNMQNAIEVGLNGAFVLG